MRYAYHFEFCERPELPEWLRGDVFLSLGLIQKLFGLSYLLIKRLPGVLAQLGGRRVIELGSGSGEDLARLAEQTELAGYEFVATDKFPKTSLWNRSLKGLANARWEERSVSFESFVQELEPENLKDSVVLLSSAFHHMDKAKARAFLTECARAKASVLVVEPLSRNVVSVFGAALLLFPALLSPLLVRGVSVSTRFRLIATHWLVPIVPFILTHDGVVSALRQRTLAEWRDLAQGLPYEFITETGLGPLKSLSIVGLKLVSHRHVVPSVA